MKVLRWWVPYLFIGGGLVIATRYDLTLAQWFYHPDQPLAIFFERLALLPVECMIPFCFYGMFQNNRHAVNIIGFVISMVIIIWDTLKYWIVMWEPWWVWVMVFLLVIILVYRFLQYIPMTFWSQNEQAMRFVLTAALFSFSVVFGLKTVWGRVRFREMAGNEALFTPWYVVCGVNAHHSFPSAHTATMSLILCRHFALALNGKAVRMKQVIVDGGVIVVMMVMRMMMGAHFFSDVLMGFAITYTIMILVYRWMRREG